MDSEVLLLISLGGIGLIFIGLIIAYYKLSSICKHLATQDNNFESTLRHFKEELINHYSQNLGHIIQLLTSQTETINRSVNNLITTNEVKFDNLKKSVEQNLYRIQQDNNDKLEKMRLTVEEKLNDMLEKKLSSSFATVSEQLEKVYRGLGEMHSLASGVGDLKRVLSNIKTRGIWGEIQLEAILTQLLAPQQYEKNVLLNPSSSERVEFAIKIPSQANSESIWIPVDSKFPLDIYHKLMEAWEIGSNDTITIIRKELETALKKQAKSIAEKYICLPYTTDFAILFLPIEGLYAEVLRISSLQEYLQHTHKIVIAGPTTLAAILNSLQMGYRALAIQKRGSEVWKLLGGVKREFGKFSTILQKVRLKLDQASKEITNTEVRTRAIERQLRDVETFNEYKEDTVVISNDDYLLDKEA